MNFKNIYLIPVLMGLFACSAEDPNDIDGKSGNSNSGNVVDSVSILSLSSTSISEKQSIASMQLLLDKKSSKEVTVKIEITGGTAELDKDYSLVSSTLTIPPGSNRVNYEIKLINDTIDEENESIDFKIVEIENATIENINQTYTLTITDDDNEPEVGFEDISYSVSENIGSYDLEFKLDRQSSRQIEVNFNIDGTAKLNEDYSIDGEYSVIINPLEMEGTKRFVIIEDNIREGGETIIIKLEFGSFYSINEVDKHTVIINGDVSLNDTGVVTFSNGIDVDLTNEPSTHPGQDASFGYDKGKSVSNADGVAGFSYTKLDGAGNEIPLNSVNWQCVRDNRTGLIWEVKNQDFDLSTLIGEDGILTSTNNYRAANYKYTFYSEDDASNGRSTGAPNDRFIGRQNFDIEGYCAYVEEEDATRKYILRCNSDIYAKEVNWYGLCGSKEWRLPSRGELKSIVNYDPNLESSSELHIDTNFFPKTKAESYISSTPSAEFSASIWCLDMVTGESQLCHKGSLSHLRLVTDAK